ncbi:MAG TPA: aspartate carbamoyltransferase [archaeon]|nr:aspartate carbamoyltransferase [archaeon]
MKEIKHIISIHDLEKEQINYILEKAKDIEDYPNKYIDALKGKVIASLFFEPSTRTKMSFETAVKKLGGNTIGFEDIQNTSAKKGETFSDAIKVIAGYSDLVVMRTKIEGASRLASEIANKPIINGGDGTNQHPTQTLLDLYTIKKEKGKLEGLSIGFFGDLKYGRTVHSLVEAISLYSPKKIKFIAAPQFQIGKEYLEMLDSKGIKYEILEDAKGNLKDLDILYVTRTQLERIVEPIDMDPLKKKYTITKALLDGENNPGLLVMHPLPRVYEITTDVDDTPHNIYFKQADNGVPVREAIICILLKVIK